MAGADIRADIAGYGRGVSRYGRSAGAPGLALTALRLSSLDDDLFLETGRAIWMLPTTRRTAPVSAHKWSKEECK